MPHPPKTRTDRALRDDDVPPAVLLANFVLEPTVDGIVLAAVGLHGLIGQTVVERRREFGIRLAIGAAPTGIVKLVLRRAALVLSVGLAAGLALAWSSGRLVESQLFGITSRDPMPYGVAALLMIAVVILASISPAVAATRVDPIEVLRSE